VVDEPDDIVNPLGIKALGEIGIVGVAAAIANAVYGSACRGSSIASFRQSRWYTRCLCIASTPEPEGGARCASSARRDLREGRAVTIRYTPPAKTVLDPVAGHHGVMRLLDRLSIFGAGRLVIARKGIAAPIRRRVVVSAAVARSPVVQQKSCIPGSPDATTIDGRYLPNQPQKFEGKIDLG